MDTLVNPEPLSVSALAFNLLLGILLSTGLAWYYAKFGEALSNRIKFARLLPILCLTTILVISVVKASLALSLGLVGALSIVRFRTAIKDPEELIYLFLAIAVGLGLGADQRIPTLVALAIIMAFLVIIRFSSLQTKNRNLYLNIEFADTNQNNTFETVNSVLVKHVNVVDMRRVDRRNSVMQATYFLDCKDQNTITGLMDDLRDKLPGCSYSFIDQSSMPGN